MGDTLQTPVCDTPRLSIKQVLKQTWAVLFKNPAVFLPIGGFTLVPVIIEQCLQLSEWESVAFAFPVMVFLYILTGMAAYPTVRMLQGEKVSITDAFTYGMRHFFPILAISALILVGTTLACLFLIIPAIILQFYWEVAVTACAVEGIHPFDSLKRSEYLTEGNRWRIFALYCICYACCMAIIIGILCVLLLIVMAIELAFDITYMNLDSMFLLNLYAILTITLLRAFECVMSSVIYCGLKELKEAENANGLKEGHEQPGQPTVAPR